MSMQKANVICSLLCVSCSMYGWFEHEQALYAGSRNDWQQAQQKMEQALVNAPDNPECMYDMGVAAYRAGSMEQAHAYFDAVAHMSEAPATLQEQACFNAGNALAGQKKFEEALACYEQILAKNPAHERAQHNAKKIRELLERQKNQPSDQKNDNQQNDQNTQQDNQQQKNDQQNSSEKNKENNNSSRSQDDKNSSSDQQKQQGNDQQSDADKSNSASQSTDSSSPAERDKNPQQHDVENSQDKKNATPHTQQTPESSSAQQSESQQDKARTSQPDQRAETGSEQRKQQAGAGQGTEQAQENKKDTARASSTKGGLPEQHAHDKWLAYVLEKINEQDAHVGKDLVKATVGKHIGGADEEHNW